MPNVPQPGPIGEPSKPGKDTATAREFRALKQRIVDEAIVAVGMVESSIRALFVVDVAAAEDILRRDDAVDREEVLIEEDIFRLMALLAPVARDFRGLAFCLKVNADIERVADHACSIAKITRKLDPELPPDWPTSLVELAQRVPITCQQLLRALVDEDVEASKRIIIDDRTIDSLHKLLFDETVDLMESMSAPQSVGLLVYRVGRELERIGDLMVNIAEDIVYLETGEIVRHRKKEFRRLDAEGTRESPSSDGRGARLGIDPDTGPDVSRGSNK